VPRANISLDKLVFDEFAAQAALEGKTLYAFTNEWLGAAAKISAAGGKAKDVFELWQTTTVLRQLDTIVLPSDFVDNIVGELYARDKAGILAAFGNLGAELVGILKIAAGSIEGIADLAKDFTLLTPIKKFEVKKKDSASIEITIVGAGKRMESTECSFEFLKSVLNGYGYEISSHELHVGTIRVNAVKRGVV
jgi:hypothetical protein